MAESKVCDNCFKVDSVSNGWFHVERLAEARFYQHDYEFDFCSAECMHRWAGKPSDERKNHWRPSNRPLPGEKA